MYWLLKIVLIVENRYESRAIRRCFSSTGRYVFMLTSYSPLLFFNLLIYQCELNFTDLFTFIKQIFNLKLHFCTVTILSSVSVESLRCTTSRWKDNSPIIFNLFSNAKESQRYFVTSKVIASIKFLWQRNWIRNYIKRFRNILLHIY